MLYKRDEPIEGASEKRGTGMSKKGASANAVRAGLWTWTYRGLLTILMGGGLMLCRLPMSAVEWIAVCAAHLAVMTLLHKIYLACDIGRARIIELTLSQTLSNVIATLVVVIGVALYLRTVLPPMPLLGALAAQEAVGVAWSLVANRMYFSHYTASRTAVIYRNEAMLAQLYATPFFERKYSVCKRISAREADLQEMLKQIADCETVFVEGVSAAVADEIAKYCVQSGTKGYFSPRIGQIIQSGATYDQNFSLPMLGIQRGGLTGGYRVVKRIIDVVGALAGIVITSPVMLITAAAIWMEDRGPVLYRQTRLTRDGKCFSMVKFRSMRVDAEKDGVARLATQNDSRITKVGRFIRACRIDELPQLLNVLAGDMSLVGPRPERPEIAREYEKELPEFALRLQVKAGLTGMAQVFGRYSTEPYHKLQMDLMYVNAMSFFQDMYLILATLKIIFTRESAEGVAQRQTDRSDVRQTPKSKTA